MSGVNFNDTDSKAQGTVKQSFPAGGASFTNPINIITGNNPGGADSWYLPDPTTFSGIIFIKDATGNANTDAIVIYPYGAEKLDQQDYMIISADYGSLLLFSNGTDWFTLPGNNFNSFTNVPLTQRVAVKWTSGGAGTLPVGTNFFAANGGVMTLTLPTPPEDGHVITIKDWTGDASTNNKTIAGGGPTIDGQASILINVDYGVARLVALNGNWYTT